MSKWRKPVIIASSLLFIAGFLAFCHSCSRFIQKQARKTLEGSQPEVGLHAKLDVSVMERVRIPTGDVIKEVRIGKLTVGKKKTGFIRLGSFNEVRLHDVDIVVTREFFSPPSRSAENVISLVSRSAEPDHDTAEGDLSPGSHSRKHDSSTPAHQARKPGGNARIRILNELKARVDDYAEGAYGGSESISSFSIRGIRVILDNDTSNSTVIIAARQGNIEKDCIRFGQRGGVEMKAAWGDATITCSQAKITLTSPATAQMSTACVRCDDSTVRYASLELPLRALVSHQAWEDHFKNSSGGD